MPSINNIPVEFKEGFEDILLLGESNFDKVVSGLQKAFLTSSIEKLATASTEFDPSLLEMVGGILLSVGSLTSVIEKGISIEEVAHDICIVLSDDIAEEFDLEDGEEEKTINENLREILEESGKQKFIERLSTLLKTERLYYAAKANDLMHEYQNVYIQARVITDIRPIFSLKTEDTPVAGLVIHNLHIHYRGDQETAHRDIFLALDSEDLKSFKEIISRAEKKEKSLNSIFKKADMDFIK